MKKTAKNTLLTVSGICLLASAQLGIGMAQTPSASVLALPSTSIEQEKSILPFKLAVGTVYNTNVYGPSDSARQRNMDFTLSTSKSIDTYRTASAVFTGNKDLTGEQLWSFTDSYLGLANKIKRPSVANQGLAPSVLFRLYLPTNKEARQIATLRGKLYLAPQMKAELEKMLSLPTFINSIGLTYRPSFVTSFYRYETGYNGKSNTPYSVSQRAIIELGFLEKFGVTLDNIYGRSWTYQGHSKDTFSFDQSVSYSPIEELSFSLGHSIGGSALKVNGKESAVELYNKNKSTFYFEMDVQI